MCKNYIIYKQKEINNVPEAKVQILSKLLNNKTGSKNKYNFTCEMPSFI